MIYVSILKPGMMHWEVNKVSRAAQIERLFLTGSFMPLTLRLKSIRKVALFAAIRYEYF